MKSVSCFAILVFSTLILSGQQQEEIRVLNHLCLSMMR